MAAPDPVARKKIPLLGAICALLGAVASILGAFFLGSWAALAIRSSRLPLLSDAFQQLTKQTGILQQIEYFLTHKQYFGLMTRYTDALAETTLNLDTTATINYSRFFLEIVAALPEDVKIEHFSFGPGILVMLVATDQPRSLEKFIGALYIQSFTQAVDSVALGDGKYEVTVTLRPDV